MVTSESLKEEDSEDITKSPVMRRCSDTCFEMKNYNMQVRCKLDILIPAKISRNSVPYNAELLRIRYLRIFLILEMAVRLLTDLVQLER